MHEGSCFCSAHDPDGDLERAFQAGIRAQRAERRAVIGIDALIRHSADQMTLDRLARVSGMA